MRETIVYFLGAGFSAPLGLPVMANFLLRSKDLYFSDPDKYKTFIAVFDMIDKMSKAKNYYNLDLFNIEDILSLLEMEDYVGSSAHKQIYLSYLRDVVLNLTPAFLPPNAPGEPFSADELIDDYAGLVASLLGLDLIWADDSRHMPRFEEQQNTPKYGVISLNYDLVVEKSLDLVRRRMKGNKVLDFATSLEAISSERRLPFAKLHGSVEPLTIVPPTWNKVASEEVKEAWRLAYRLLADATQIRFLGYSLPPSDTYVRYLLESAVLESQYLSRVDVICLDDPQHSVETRFRSLITFYRFRFKSGDLRQYLNSNNHQAKHNPTRDPDRNPRISYNKLEKMHEAFMRST